MRTAVMVTLMVGMAGAAGAQVMVHEDQSKPAAEQHLQLLLEQAPASGVHVTLETRAVPGAPYVGEAVTESVHVFADGNRIVRRNVVRVYRDGSGRTRREILGSDGAVETVTISDPSKGVTQMLHPATQTAHETVVATTRSHVNTFVVDKAAAEKAAQAAQLRTASETGVSHAEHTEQVRATVAQSGLGLTTVGPVSWVSHASTPGNPPTKEDLGQQTIEGLLAKGTRSTTVIPAGAIGNEQAITVVSEEWFSPDLKVLVMTKHADPRTGETTYRLTNIFRGEPDPSLFERPAGYIAK